MLAKDFLCPVCQEGKEFDFIMESSLRGGAYSLYFCKTCKVQFWHPMANPGNEWYQHNNPYRVRDIAKTKVYRGYHKKFLERAKHLPKNLVILDLGCGTGEFLEQLSTMGFDTYGVDFDKDAIEIARKRFGLKNVFSASFEDFFAKTNLPKFDIITFFEVLEHLDNHPLFFSSIKKLLKPGGKIILSTPSRDRVLVNWNTWDFPPHHFTRWNLESIKHIFSKHGFTVDFIGYVETFKIIMGAIDGKLRSGLVQKTLHASIKNRHNLLFAKLLYLAAKIKQWAVAGIPAILLWIFGKATRRNNGIMYAELHHE